MRVAYQFLSFTLIGMGAFLAGLMNFYSPDDVLLEYYGFTLTSLEPGMRSVLETQTRLLSGMWIAAGLGIFLCVKHFERHAAVFRLVAAGLVLSSIGELVTAQLLGNPLFSAIIKVIFQAAVCGGLEFWRTRLAAKLLSPAEIP